MDKIKIATTLLKNEGKIEKTVVDYNCSAIDDLVRSARLSLHYVASKAGDEFLLRGSVSGCLVVNCGKCLKDFEIQLDSMAFTQSYEPSTLAIDVDDEARQTLLLNIPLHPVCSHNCKGLCAKCGVNLNESKCNCRHEEKTDARWEKLKELL